MSAVLAGAFRELPRAERAFGGIFRAVAALLAIAPLAGCGPTVVWSTKSPDRAHTASVLHQAEGQKVRIDEREGPIYRGIGTDGLLFSPDGARVAYPARTQSGWVVVVSDGKAIAEGRPYDGIGEITFSSDGAHTAYAAEKKGRWLVVVDGREDPSFETLRARSLRLSPDGAHWAYAADEDRKVVVVSDGLKSRPFDAVGHIVLGPRGEAAFVGRDGKSTLVVLGRKESPPYEDIADLALSPKTGKAAYTARKNGAWHVIEEGSESGPFDRVSALLWAASADVLAYVAGRGETELVVSGGVPGPSYDAVLPGSLALRPTGSAVAYGARKKGRFYVVAGAKESEPYDDVEAPLFVGDSEAVAFLARRGEATMVVIDGNAGDVRADASSLAMSPDGSRFLFAATAGKECEVVEGRVTGMPCGGGRCSPVVTRVTRHDIVVGGTLLFSPSGAHSAYLAGELRKRSLYLVLDGQKATPFYVSEMLAELSGSPSLGGALLGETAILAGWVRAEATLAERRASAPKEAGNPAQARP